MSSNENRRATVLDQLATRNLDLHGRVFGNAGRARLNQDLVPLSQLQELIAAATGSGGGGQISVTGQEYSLQANGIQAIASDVCPRRYIGTNGTSKLIRAELKIGPTGADFKISLYQVGVILCTLAILDGTSVIELPASGFALSAGNYWRVDITQVGSTYPGSDLVVTILD